MSRLQYHPYQRWGPARRPFGPLRVLLYAVLLAGAVVVTVALVSMLLAFGTPVLAVVGAITVGRHLHRRRHRPVGRGQHPAAAMQTPPRLTTPVAGHPPVPDWPAARARFAQLRSEYSQFECDPLAVLRLPALTDVSVASTGRFVDAFAEAQALDTDTEPPAAHRARYAAAVDQACRTWRAALDAAERIRLAGIPAEERTTVQRAIKLLIMARDSDHDAERIAAYVKARAELAKLDRTGTLRLPRAAAAALDAGARGQLPPASAAS